MAKINQQIADEIRQRYSAGEITQKQLATEYGIAQSKISAVITGQTWIGKRGGWPKGKSRPPQTPAHIAKRFANGAGAQVGVKQTPEHIEKCRQLRIGKKINCPNRSAQIREQWGRGVYDELFKRNTRFIYKSAHGDVGMRSNWERLAAAHFDKLGLPWEYEPRKFRLPTGQYYWPDFYLPSLNRYIEIKGFCTFNAMAKFDLFVGLGHDAVLVTGQTDVEFLEELRDAVFLQVKEVTV